MPSKLRMPFILSTLIALLAIVSSVGPFTFALYRRDPPFALGAQLGTDLVTLFLAVPLLLLSMLFARHGSPRAKLVWIGMLEYMLYNFIYYLLGAALNEFFLIYVALCSLSMFALIIAMNNAGLSAIGAGFKPAAPAKKVGLYMLLFAALLIALWTIQWYRLTFAGVFYVGLPADAVHLVAAVDMTLFAPVLIVVAVMLRRRNPLGYAHATSLMVMATVYPIVLLVSAPFQADAGVRDIWTTAPLWAALVLGSFISAVALLRNAPKKPAE